ncbi:MAG: polymer-forming cytoskeletal protein [Rhodospirillaceae bacterium]|nr:polymer-forming cytoskeletal protein [Rhodospirillaceae bacterium]MBT6116454.1 polymer-forming cytoskeletal protein [Rhodospirillaceae bacterium]
MADDGARKEPPLKFKGNTPVAHGARVPPTPGTAPADVGRGAPEVPVIARRAAEPRPGPLQGEGKKLVVGRDIALNGEISACDRLIVEGEVNASLAECREIEIADGGVYKGAAEIETAEIAGLFEGEMIAHNRLIIRHTGVVRGKIRYGMIEIQPGGLISGDIAELDQGAHRLAVAGNRSTSPFPPAPPRPKAKP